MKPEEFINTIKNLKPTKEELLDAGIDEDGIERILNSYIILPREYSIELEVKDDFYRNLVSKYDISNIEIGPICFPEKPIDLTTRRIIIAYDGSDPIVLDKFTDEILLLDMVEQTHVMAFCARNVKSFFSALLIAIDFLETLSKDESLWDDPENATPTIAQCTLIAGGKKYQQFYEMLVGLEE